MVTLTIDNKKVKAENTMTILEAARAAGIDVPTLCSSDALGPYGACRLCVVEIESSGKVSMESSCTYPVCEGLVVRTRSRRVMDARRHVLELLLARSPNVKRLQDLARMYGVRESPPQWATENEYCILCGLCVRACNDVVKAGAIQFVGRGTAKEVASPLQETREACIGCGSCAFVCPTGIIRKQDLAQTLRHTPDGCEEEGPMRVILNWQVEHAMQICVKCGNPYAPVKHLEKIARDHGYEMEFYNLCPSCRVIPQIDKELCTACNACIVVCPVGASQFVEYENDQKSHIFPENCCGCNSCVGVCGWGAVKVGTHSTQKL